MIHEPATLLTDYLLVLLGGYLAYRLHRHCGLSNINIRWWFKALLALALSAFVGGSYHGFAPNFPETVDAVWWRIVLWIMCFLGYAMGSALMHEVVPDEKQDIWKKFLIVKLLIAILTVMVHPQFVIAIVDYGSVMLAWGVTAIFTKRRWRSSMIVAVGFSALAAWVQQSGFGFPKYLNHNDVFHLIQALALVSFYCAATRMSELPLRK